MNHEEGRIVIIYSPISRRLRKVYIHMTLKCYGSIL
uniref:Uncharacterized protein n=1 Tax=Arundo donax TaxID=35708 RepID=A0A0A8ZT30_ARUDO